MKDTYPRECFADSMKGFNAYLEANEAASERDRTKRALEVAVTWVHVYQGALLLEEHTAKPEIAETAMELRKKVDKALAEISKIMGEK